MSSFVWISCLIVVAILGGVTGLPEPQYDGEKQSQNNDIRSILLDDHLEMRGGTCGKAKLACRLSGGRCQSKTIRCEGNLLTGRQYCRKSNTCGCCVPTPTRTPKGCVFGETAFPNGDIIEDTCMQLVCVDGDWKYIGQTHRNCGECIVHGEPHIDLYKSYDVQTYNGTGTYVISQLGFKENSLFGVNSNFDECNGGWSCVQTATYYEPGINVTLILPSLSDTDYCNNLTVSDPATDPRCMIKVLVNEEERTIDETVKSFCGTDGNILVFKHNHINSSEDLNCMNVVGSMGFSVSLCQYANDYAWLYIWAMPSLKNQIYGLCDTFPEGIFGYTTLNGSVTYDYTVSAQSWKIDESLSSTPLGPGSDRCDNSAVLREIEVKCNETFKVCPIHNSSFYESCVYDMCRVINPDRYLEGYATHAIIHRQISVSAPTCNCKYEENYWSQGCVITEAALSGTACQCIRSWAIGVNYCFGRITTCKNESSTYCINPDKSFFSCEQGQGNCGGYMFSRH